MPCPRCGEPAIGPDGICRNCGLAAYNAPPPPYPGPPAGPPMPPFGSPYAPGYPMPYQQPPTARRNVQGLGTALRVFLGLAALLGVGMTFAAGWRYQLISDLLDGTADTQLNTVRLDDSLVRLFFVGLILAYLVCLILLICWLYAARTNAGTYTPVPFSFGRGWTIGAWFIPFGSLVLPLLITREIHKATVSRPGEQQRSGGALAGWWWGLWLAGNGTLYAALKAEAIKTADVNDPDANLRGLKNMAVFVVPGMIFHIAAAIVLMALVRKISKIQTARNTEPPFSGFPTGFGPLGFGQGGFGPPAYGPAGYGPASYGQPGVGQPANPYPPAPNPPTPM